MTPSVEALDADRWAVPARCERGYTLQLPDVAVWPEGWEVPGAVIAESGGRREDRQKFILEGWRDAVWSGRYVAVRYDCVSQSAQLREPGRQLRVHTGSEYACGQLSRVAEIPPST